MPSTSIKIAFITDIPADTGSWIGRYFPWAKYLALHGNWVQLYHPNHNFPVAPERPASIPGLVTHVTGLPYFVNAGEGRHHYSTWKLILIAAGNLRRTLILLFRFQPNIVIVGKPLPVSVLIGLFYKWVLRKKVFLDCDDFEQDTTFFNSSLQRYLVSFFERLSPLFFTMVTTHTTYNRTRLLGYGVKDSKLVILPNGVDPERFTATESPWTSKSANEPVILYCGDLNLSTGHAVDVLVDAMSLIRERCPQVKLWIVGDGIDKTTLQSHAKLTGVESQIVWHGRVPAENVVTFLLRSNVVVDPVRNTLNNLSRSPLKIVEALYLGKPVVTSDVGDRRALLQGSGIFVLPGDASALAEGILESLLSPTAFIQTKINDRRNSLSWSFLTRRFAEQCLIEIHP